MHTFQTDGKNMQHICYVRMFKPENHFVHFHSDNILVLFSQLVSHYSRKLFNFSESLHLANVFFVCVCQKSPIDWKWNE